MTIFYEGALQWNTLEVFDNERTRRNMAAARAANLIPANFTMIPNTEDCGGIGFGGVDNPWESTLEASESFLGFWVFSAQGLDGRVNQRQYTPRVSYPYGSNVSKLMPTHRMITYEFAIVATEECGIEYGYEWLRRRLGKSLPAYGECSECSPSQITVFACDLANTSTFEAWYMEDAGLAEGPEIGDWLTPDTAPYARMATVSIVAGDPNRYTAETIVAFGTTLDTTAPIVATCFSFTGGSDGLFDLYPIIEVFGFGGGASAPVRIEAFANPSGSCCPTDPASYTGYLFLETLAVPAGKVLRINGARQTVNLSSDAGYPDGSPYIDISGGFIQWGDLSCAETMCVRITALTAGSPTKVNVYSIERAGS